jgi:hypothetical protein
MRAGHFAGLFFVRRGIAHERATERSDVNQTIGEALGRLPV